MNRCAVLLCLLLAACGQSGPLYLPAEPPAPEPAAEPPEDDDEEDRD